MKNRILVALAIIFAALTGGAVIAGTSNDIILKEDKYNEYFKKEGNGDKNYLYTETEFKDRWGRECTVVTGASETAIALDCDRREP